MDITPRVAPGRMLVEGYGEGGFQISGERYGGSVIVLPEEVLPWDVGDFAAFGPDSLAPLVGRQGEIDVLLLGCGPQIALLPRALRESLREQGLTPEPMDTGAACRTFNVLITEDRRVGAALIAVS